jgi:pimeloyl-ACP methyl ester carboxylesterase
MTRTAASIVEIRRGSSIITALDWGGTGPAVVLLHPNGFCAGLFEPIARGLPETCRPIAIDLRGHGTSTGSVDAAAYGFDRLAADVAAVIDAMALDRVVGVGASLGGAVAIMADKANPGLWQGLLLAEPVAFPAMEFGLETENPMAAGARRRRRTFPNQKSMIAAYSRRAPLSELAPEALEAYVRWGTTTDSEGTHLRCDPKVEATIFEVSATTTGASAAWDHLPRLSCPLTIVAGSETFLPDMFTTQAEHAGAPLLTVPGGHFVLHEDTARGVELIDRHVLEPARR